MEIYKPNTNQINVAGITYTADADGIIDLPDDKITSRIWQNGFVSAKGRRAQLEREQLASIATPTTIVIDKPAKAMTDTAIKNSKKDNSTEGNAQ